MSLDTLIATIAISLVTTFFVVLNLRRIQRVGGAFRLRRMTNLPVRTRTRNGLLPDDAKPLQIELAYATLPASDCSRIRQWLIQAGCRTTIPMLTAKLTIIGFAMALLVLVRGWSSGLASSAAAAPALVTFVWYSYKRKRRIRQFETQIPLALESMARSVRTGNGLQTAIESAIEATHGSVASELRALKNSLNLGIPIGEAFNNFAVRAPTDRLRFVAAAISMYSQTGGNIAAVLDRISRSARERNELLGQVQSLSAEGRLSGIALLALPPIAFVAVYQVAPDYLQVLLQDSLGKKLLVGTVLLQLFGAIAINRMIAAVDS